MKGEGVFQFVQCVLSLVLFSLLSNTCYIRKDMSAEHFYSLSEYTKEVLQNLDSSVELSWFRSSAFSSYSTEASYMLDILREMQFSSSKKCILKLYNADEIEEAKLISLGLSAQQIEQNSRHKIVRQNIYSGLHLQFKGQNRTIPFVATSANLEYEIVNLILQMSRSYAKIENKICMINASKSGNVQYLKQWLNYGGFIVEDLILPLNEEIELSSILFVVGSFKIDEISSTFIDVFLKKGGKAVFFVSGNSIDVAGQWEAHKKAGDVLIELLAEYGILIESDLVMDIANFPLKMLSEDGSSSKTINYPLWPTLILENIEHTSMLFSSISSLQTFWPSSISLNKEKNKTVQSLATTTQNSVTMEKDYITDPFAQLFSFFEKGKHEKKCIIAIAKKPGHVIVVSDENMVGEAIEYTNSPSNMEFALNVAFYLSGQEEVLRLREKKHEIKPFRFYEDGIFTFIIAKARVLCFVVLPVAIMFIYVLIKRKLFSYEK